MNRLKLFIVVLLSTLGTIAFAGEFETLLLKAKVINHANFKVKDPVAWKKNVDSIVANQNSDGTWPDIDYTAVNSLDFSPKTHLSRAVILSEAFATPDQSYYQNKNLLGQIWKAYDHWIKNDYQSYNWWNNEIGVQQYLLKVILLTSPHMSSERVANGIKFARRTVIRQTGQNLLWRAEVNLLRGIITKDNSVIRAAVAAIQSLTVFDKEEGIQVDGSFFQHGQLIYNGGYGDKFILIMSKLLVVLDDSSFDFPSASKQKLIDHVIKNQFWLTRANKYDYGVIGRSITIKNRDALNLGEACLVLSGMKVKEQSEFTRCAQSILKNQPSGIEGNKAFWKADFMVQHEKDYYASIRMYSKRTINNDAPSNGEGLKSHHLADGAMFLMKDGSEYQNIFPVWDWNNVPGTTAEQKYLLPAEYIPGRPDLFAHIRFYGISNFVGTVSNGRYGTSAMEFISNPLYDQLKIKKSWFFFKDSIMAMGSDINCPGCAPVVTTLNQTISKTKVVVIDSNKTSSVLTAATTTKSNIYAVSHQDVGYVFPKVQNVTVNNKMQSGDWSDINSSLKPEAIKLGVFSATINHGSNPVDELYEYLILPNKTAADLALFNFNQHFNYINSNSVQAVYSKSQKMLQAVFYKVDPLELGGLKIEVSDSCLLMVEVVGKELVVTLSDPTQLLESLKVTINGVSYSAKMRKAPYAGSSITAKN